MGRKVGTPRAIVNLPQRPRSADGSSFGYTQEGAGLVLGSRASQTGW
jgi:hypothetical protein